LLEIDGAEEPVRRGSTFGRYMILDRIGAGGMGVVYKAFDPELDRQVALKLVRTDRDDVDGRERLLREAQAMARLAHPNVISVFDVGSLGDRVFVAMEYVAGLSLARWQTKPHTWREVVEVFLQAGRGLAAAHRARLIHRDFKPDNVIVGEEGRVRVLDFGLARALDAEGEPDSSGSGTPVFMSPEQHQGLPVDPRTDQFSFCVALYEALYGTLPFQGDTYRELADAVLAGRIEPALRGTSVPTWLRRVITRGLAVHPADRHASMDALLAELSRDRVRTRRRVAVAAAMLALAGAGVGAYAQGRARAAAVCDGAEARLAGAWDDDTRAHMQTAFEASGRPYARATFESVARTLDGWSASWVAARTEACQATQRGEQSSELLDLRMACLDERREQLRALGSVLATADGELVDRAIESAGTLGAVDDCARAALLAGGARLPEARLRPQVAALRARIADAHALLVAARVKPGLASAQAAVADADAIDFRPVQGEALLVLGSLQARAGDPKSAEETLRRGARAALAGHDVRTAARALLELTDMIGSQLQQPDRALDVGTDAGALVEALADPVLEAELADARGVAYQAAGKDDPARAQYERAVELLVKARPASLELGRALNDLGGAYRRHHEYARALVMLARALAIRDKLLGPEHPACASPITNMGNVLYAQGKYAEAIVYYRRSLAIQEHAFGPEHPLVAEALQRLGDALDSAGQRDEARAMLERAVAIQEKVLGPDHPELGRTLSILGNVYNAVKELDRALAVYQRALAIKEKALGPEHPSVAVSLYQIGKILVDQKRFDEGQALYARALAIDTKAHGADDPELAFDYTGIGEAYLSAGRPGEAIPPLTRALELRSKAQGDDPTDLAETRFMLARALWERGDHARAVVMARSAHAVYAAAGPGMVEQTAFIAKWLKEHTT
jgi:tetratricopeptide (TPR) repeat protein/predicted Ser/Thr protein kinase